MNFHAGAVEHEAALDVLGLRPQRQRLAVLVLAAVLGVMAGRVIELAVLDAPGHAELAACALGRRVAVEGEVGQVAAQAQADVLRHAAFQRTAQPGAQIGRSLQRQVAVDTI